MECTHFTVTSIDSQYVPSNNNTDPSIDLGVSGISATCKGKYASMGLGGTVEASVASDPDTHPSLGMSVAFIPVYFHDTIRMANSTSTTGCVANLLVPSDGISFSGSISAHIINLFSGSIAGYVSSALASELCPVLEEMTDASLTMLIQKADHYLSTILPSSSTTTTTTTTTSTTKRHLSHKVGKIISWQHDTPVLTTLLKILNNFLSDQLNEGFFLRAINALGLHDVNGDCGYFFRGVNGIIHSFTKNGELHVRVPKGMHRLRNMTFEVPGYAAVSILPLEVSVGGLDSLTEASLFDPTNDNRFHSSFTTLNGLNVSLRLDLQVSSIPGGMFRGDPLLESFLVLVNSTSLAMSGDLDLLVDAARFGRVSGSQILNAINHSSADLGCLVLPVDSLAVPTLSSSATVPAISFSPVASQDKTTGELEKDLDIALNNILELFLTEFPDLVSASIKGISDGPLRKMVIKLGNDFIEKLLSTYQPTDHACQTTGHRNNQTTDFLNFGNIGIVHRIQHFLNKTSTLQHINSYIQCVQDVLNTQVLPKIPSLDYAGVSVAFGNTTVDGFDRISSIGTHKVVHSVFPLYGTMGRVLIAAARF